MRLSTGQVLVGRYHVDRYLGRGGMGEVWAARDGASGPPVAIKRLLCRPSHRRFAELKARFAREARSAVEVRHPNVVEVLEFVDQEHELPLIVMELLEGETLRERLARQVSLAVPEVADVFLPVVSAVGAAHSRGIVHRDLKPANVFLVRTRHGHTSIKVLDFGVAKWLAGTQEDGALRTRTGSTLGTPEYMAPEQALGERDVDHRADVWALGVMLYEACSGARPVEGANVAQVMRRLTSSAIVPVEHLVPLPPALSRLIGSMLSRQRLRRPQDLREAYAVLADLAGVRAPAFGAPLAAL